MSDKEKTIEQLVSDNPSIASALHFLGIHFLNYSEQTLDQICQARNWNVKKIEQWIADALAAPSVSAEPFDNLPIDLLVQYLKHNHYLFIKKRLPFIGALVKNFEGSTPPIKQELQLVFPLFVDDFINHIYEEEDTLFSYINLMHLAVSDQVAFNKVQSVMLDNSIKQFQSEHAVHDDHLKGLRELTNNYMILPEYDLNTKVVLSELKKFDDELFAHASIENTILFPKALELETRLLAHVQSNKSLN